MDEQQRIKEVYANRDSSGKRILYSWSSFNSNYQSSVKSRMIATALYSSFGANISNLSTLDVGCGTGGFLRLLLEWGADPVNCVGTEFLEDRLERGKKISPKGVCYYLGSCLDFNEKKFDLVSAHTVFSSILDDDERGRLALEMWHKVCDGGWIMIFDFRYNNPSNPRCS